VGPRRLARVLLIMGLLIAGFTPVVAEKGPWVELKSPHFVAYSDAGESEAREILQEFEEIRAVFLKVFPGLRVDAPKPMILIAVRDQDSLKQFLPREFVGRTPNPLAGQYYSCFDRNYAILRLDIPPGDQPYFTLFHEYTHGILHLNFPGLPVWLDEGLADFYGATQIQSNQVLIGRTPPSRQETIHNNALLPLETLLSVTHDSPRYRESDKSGVFYSQSWALVHYLLMNEQARKAGLFQAYLKAWDQSHDPVAAARVSFGDLDKAMGVLNGYVCQPRFLSWSLDFSLKVEDTNIQSRVLDGTEAVLVRAEFLQHSGQEALAQPLLTQVLALAPKRPEVHAALGFGHILRNEYEEASLTFEEALRLGSQDFRVPYYLAWLSERRTPTATRDSGHILAWLETARALCPDFPSTHLLLCQEYSRDPRTAGKALLEGRLAVELEPWNLAHLVNLGHVCLSLDLDPEAKAIGGKLNRLASGQQEKQLAQNYARFLEQQLAWKQARVEGAATPVAPSSGAHPRGSSSRQADLKFSLPSHLAPLGQEVLKLRLAGKTAEAIRKVQAALKRSQNDWERKILRTLLAQLKEQAPVDTPAKDDTD